MLDILFYGDSLLIGSGLEGDFVPGRTIDDALHDEYKEIGINLAISEAKCDTLVVCLGTNDLASYPATIVISRLKEFLDTVSAAVDIFVVGWPHESKKINTQLESSLPDRVLFIPFEIDQETDLCSDRVHLNQTGFAKIRDEINFQLEQPNRTDYWSQNERPLALRYRRITLLG